MAARKPATPRSQKIVKDAIAHAQKTAGKDGRAYVEALRTHVMEHVPAPTPPSRGGRALSIGLRANTSGTHAHGKGPRLNDDPRYHEAVRALARRTMRNARIIGGSDVKAKEFLDCVAVGSSGGWGCTGTLIAPTVVLTAGHCKSLHDRIFVGNDVSGTGRTYEVADHLVHESWTSDLENDLMLLILKKPVKNVTPRPLATTSRINAATDGRVVGFGTTDFGGTTGYGRKQQTDVPIVSSACDGKVGGRRDGSVYGCHLGKEIVAGKPLFNHDTCKGDSGGPFYIMHGDTWLLAGVTSRGTDAGTRMCGDGGVYTRVDVYRDWIASALK